MSSMIGRLVCSIAVVLCIATAALWFRTLHVADRFTLLTHADTRYELGTRPHGIDCVVTTHFRSHPPTWDPISPYEQWREGWSYSAFDQSTMPLILTVEPEHHLFGAGYDSTAENWTSSAGVPITRRTTTVVIPFWLILFAIALPCVPPACRLVKRWRRLRANRCPGCGYDLRETPGRCPECGFVPHPNG